MRSINTVFVSYKPRELSRWFILVWKCRRVYQWRCPNRSLATIGGESHRRIRSTWRPREPLRVYAANHRNWARSIHSQCVLIVNLESRIATLHNYCFLSHLSFDCEREKIHKWIYVRQRLACIFEIQILEMNLSEAARLGGQLVSGGWETQSTKPLQLSPWGFITNRVQQTEGLMTRRIHSSFLDICVHDHRNSWSLQKTTWPLDILRNNGHIPASFISVALAQTKNTRSPTWHTLRDYCIWIYSMSWSAQLITPVSIFKNKSHIQTQVWCPRSELCGPFEDGFGPARFDRN